MMKTTFKRIAVGTVTAALTILPMVAFAAAPDLGLNEANAGLNLGSKDIRETVGTVINTFMGLLGLVAVVIVLIGGFQWMTAGGNEEKVQEAKKRILAGIIGLVIIMSAYAISKFVVDAVLKSTT